MAFVWTQNGLEHYGRQLHELDGPPDSLLVRLFQSATTIAFASVLSDLTECDFGGYSEVEAFPGTPEGFLSEVRYQTFMAFVSGPGRVPITFIPDGTTPNTVFGYYLVRETPGPTFTLMGGRNFAVPLVMALPADGLSFSVRVLLAQG